MGKYTTLFTPDTNWNQQPFKDIRHASVVAVDLETKDPNLRTMGSGAARMDGQIIGIAVAIDGWKAYYPIAHEQGTGSNLDSKLVWKWFKKNVADTDATKVFHNAMYDVSWLRAYGIELKGKIEDTMILASLVDENRYSYSLQTVAGTYIGKAKDEKILKEAADSWGIDPKAEMYKMPPMFVGKYAERDAEVTLQLWKSMRFWVEQERVEDIADKETDLFPCLVDMKFKGVRFDIEGAARLQKEFKNKEEEVLHEIKKQTNIDLDLWAAASIQKVFDTLKIKYDKTEKGNPSFTKGFMSEHSHPLVKAIASAREYNKARSTFIDSLTKHYHKGRIHAEINQLRSDQGGTVT